jgi:hypothetical protein
MLGTTFSNLAQQPRKGTPPMPLSNSQQVISESRDDKRIPMLGVGGQIEEVADAYTEDATVLPPDSEPIRGHAAIRLFWRKGDGDDKDSLLVARVIQTVTAAREIAQRDAAAARAAGNEAEADNFEAAAREAEQRLRRLRGIGNSSQASTSGWWLSPSQPPERHAQLVGMRCSKHPHVEPAAGLAFDQMSHVFDVGPQ